MRGFLLKGAIAFTILFGIFTFFAWDVIFLSFKDEVDMYDDNFDIIKHGDGGRIIAEINLSLGEAVSETTTSTKNGSVTSSRTDHYYVVPVWSGEDTYYVCVKVDEKNRSLYNKITNQTYDYLEGEDISSTYVKDDFEGTIKELDDELYDYMLEWGRESEMYDNETELRNYMLPLYLEPLDFDNAGPFMIVAIILLAIAIVLFVLFFVTGRTRRPDVAPVNAMGNDTMINGMPINTNMPQYNPDLYNAPSYNSNPQYGNDINNSQYTQNNQNNGF